MPVIAPASYNGQMSLGRPLRAAAIFFLLLLPIATANAQNVEVGDGGPGPFKAPHLTVELTALAPQIAVGGTLQAGLVITIEEHWHVYWINPGDSGLPPEIKWTLPNGITAAPLQFSAPQMLPLGPFMDFGYEDLVAFPITLTAASGLKPGKVHLDAHVNWLVCASQCLPGKAHLGLDLDIVPGPLPDPPLVGALGTAIANLPKPLPAGMSVTAVGGSQKILVTLTTGSAIKDADFYPFDADQIDNPANQGVQGLPDGVSFHLKRASDSTALPKTLHGLIKLSDELAYEVNPAIVPGDVPATATPAGNTPTAPEAKEITLFGALGLAFLGGLLLNLMPCVFPVLFLKGLALVNSSNEDRGRQRLHGLVYTLGILVSFWIIVAALLTLRATGKELGWGFQLQSPGFVAVLAALLFFLALSLAGQFEIGLSLTSAGGDLANKQGLTGSFFTGVLATVVATPCMAPLMGAAVGFALAQPAWVTFFVFTFLALGLAAPYLALSMQPQWTAVLPKPGAWMEVLKQLTAVPLFATAIWLTWVYAHLYAANGIDRMVALLICYLILAIAGWVLGRWPAKWGSSIAAVLLILFAISLPLRKITVETLTWQPYNAATLEAARASGQPIFVDFTAAWCLSCQVNERAVLQSAQVESTLISNHFVLLKADWTQYDPYITEQLSKLDRSGVPTYVLYPPGKTSNPDVLPELLTKDLVLKAIKRDAK